jgi:hypothetical protein
MRSYRGIVTLTPEPRPNEEPPGPARVTVELEQNDEYRSAVAPRTTSWTARARRQHEGVRALMGYRVVLQTDQGTGIGVVFTDGRIQGIEGSPLGLPEEPPRMGLM